MIRLRVVVALALLAFPLTRAWADPKPTDGIALGTGVADTAAISPDGTVIATTPGQSVSLWKATDGSAIATCTGLQAQIGEVVFSHDGTLLAASNSDGQQAGVFDVKSHALVCALKVDGGAIPLGFGADNATVITAGTAITIFNAKDGSVAKSIKLPANQVGLALTPDGKEVVGVGHFDGKITAWDLESGSARPFKQDAKSTSPMGGSLTPAGTSKVALASFMGGSVYVFDEKTGLMDHKIGEVHAQNVCFTAKGDRFAYGTWNTMADNFIVVTDAKSGKAIVNIGPFSKDAVFATVRITDDGKTLVAVPKDGPPRLYHLTGN